MRFYAIEALVAVGVFLTCLDCALNRAARGKGPGGYMVGMALCAGLIFGAAWGAFTIVANH